MKRSSSARISLASALASLIRVFNCDGAQAATNTVSSAADNGAGTLRQAIFDAAWGDYIIFSSDATTINLTSGELTINKDLTISDSGVSGGAATGLAVFIEIGCTGSSASGTAIDFTHKYLMP
jgi:hypothetical protein